MTTRSASRDEQAPRRRLGRGLESLLGTAAIPVRVDLPAPAAAAPDRAPPETDAGRTGNPDVRPERAIDRASGQGPGLHHLPVARVTANPQQPRRHFDDAALEALSQSIRTCGVMQPIVVRPLADGSYEIVAGERRWRAALRLGLAEIPAVVRELDDRTAAEWSLVENLQREDLNPIERAEALRRLATDHGLTHQEIADRVGLDRSSVSNHLRLCELDAATRAALVSGELDMGHGKALLGVQDLALRERLRARAIAAGWSVRELERQVRSLGGNGRPARMAGDPADRSPSRLHMADLEKRVGVHLGTKVTIVPGRRKGTGSMTIEFFSFEQFEGILERLGYREP
ncbi:MAG: ParB/RepB/Spo0J family partition protein [Phycisphaeraceae bacterium]|nr:ParB/RepB/Spo0J family partition protein [Phycisphaeraceae bacterium]